MKTIRTQGIKGGEYSAYKKFGALDIVPEANNFHSRARISIDNFTGTGKSYSEREESLINITDFDGNVIFTGSMFGLIKKLKSGEY